MFFSLCVCDCELARKVLEGCQKHAEERTQAARVVAAEKQGGERTPLLRAFPSLALAPSWRKEGNMSPKVH